MAAFFRIFQSHWAAKAMDGEGAYLYGGRWNPPGHHAVYLAESRALAALEILVHAPREALLLDWSILRVELADEMIEECGKIPQDWRARPSSNAAQNFGMKWLETRRNLALRLPSVIIPEESCLLFNPRHQAAREAKIAPPQPFRFDQRL